ncbi:hypothetical protein M0C34_17430 [Agarivorans sp. TSD2052]|uniref:DUF6701 domain-containing protein n=1 Tax=Agarivorans sp. TSD2052 TaxID=2937286 RepID=UPI0020101C3A|nr:DUF6701 domain-containing protein [Agarivorans sp. TSD2052]UPW17994.1 hypothetical protein M0C34_17430 [Agarivorans sp. TSD2052]
MSITFRLLLTLLGWLVFSASHADWSDSFVEGVNSYTSDGEIEFVWSAKLYGAPNNRKLPANVVTDPSSNACVKSNGQSGECREKGTSDPLALKPEGIPLFSECRSTSNDNISPEWSDSIELSEGEYGDIYIDVRDSFKFVDDGGVYKIKNLTVNNGTVEFAAGQYWVENLTLNYGINVILPSSGSVVFFIESDYRHNGDYVGDVSKPESLIFYSYGNFVQNGGSTLNAFVFSEQSASLDGSATLNGAITGDDVLLNGSSEVSFQDRASLIDVTPNCESANTPLSLQFGTAGAGQNGGSVTFDQAYQDKPLVFLMAPIEAADPNDDGPVAAILTSVNQDAGSGLWTGFTWARQEPPYNSTASKNIQALDWVAVNEGEHVLEDGTELRAGTISTNTAFPFPDRDYVNVDMPSNLSVVLHQKQSRNNNCWLTSNSEYNNNGIRLAIDSSEVYQIWYFARYCESQNTSIFYTDLQEETVAYLATEPTVGAITVNGETINYQFGNSLTHGSGGSTLTPEATCNYTTSYQNNLFSSPPILVASKNERRGNNGGWLRRCQHNAANFSMITEEDQYRDNERNHLAESFSYMAFSSSQTALNPGLNILANDLGLTCDIHQFTIQATLDGQIDQTFQGTVSITSSNNAGSWSNINGQGSLVLGTNPSQASYTFATADAGEVTLGLLNPLEGEITVTVNDGAIEATKQVTFNTYGLRGVLSGAWGENPHKANTNINLELTAVGKDPDGGAGCSLIANYQGTKDISFWTSYNQPSTGFSQLAVRDQVSNSFVDVATNEASRTVVKTIFSGGSASAVVKYPDVGKLAINFWDEVGTVVDDNTQDLQGSVSAELIPDKFVWQSISNQDGELNPESDNHASQFAKSGLPFSSWLVALIADCTPSSATSSECNARNFVADTTKLQISAELASPVNGEMGEFIAGVFNSDLNQADGAIPIKDNIWKEVGSIRLLGHVSEYLNYDLNPLSSIYNVAEASSEVGMFYPHHFELSQASIVAACIAGDFSYIGQQAQQLTWQLQAENAFDDITVNYSEGIYPVVAVADNADDWRFVSSSVIEDFDDGFTAESTTETWQDGIFWQQDLLSGLAKTVQTQSPVIDGAVGLYFNHFDSGISSDPNRGGFVCGEDSDSSFYCELGIAPKWLHGRITPQNSFGSELQPIAVTSELQYFDAGRYVRNTDDTCSDLTLATLDFTPKRNATTAEVGNGSSTVALRNPGIANQGLIWVDFSAPGDSNVGQVDYWFNLESELNWLRDDWNGNGSFDSADDQAGAGEVTFGVFRQSDRVIYRRMVY